MEKFKALGLNKKMISVLEELKFKEPSEIQEQTIPLVLAGKDVIGNASTGSGKTLAFASAIVQNLTPGAGIQALVLTPTRELAEQITGVTKKFATNTNLNIQEVYGGVSIENQIKKLGKADVIIGTPGRVLDHLERRTMELFELKILVLDEADRMVDMGFLPDVERIIKQCPIKRQTLLFSATTSPDVQYIESRYMKNPTVVTVTQYVDSSKLHQYYYDSPNYMKFSLLVHLLKKEKSGIVMVFCNTRKNVDLIVANLKRFGIPAHAIHGGLTQSKRNFVMDKFRKDEAEILVCTDVAARGLDLKGVTHVYNYDIPGKADEYIHRIGRTARAGKEGMAVNIVTDKDYDNFRRIMMNDSFKIERIEFPNDIEKLAPSFKDQGYGKIGGNKRFYKGERTYNPNRQRFQSGNNYGGNRDRRPGSSYGGGSDRRDSHNSRDRGSRPFSRTGNRRHSQN